MVAVRRAFNTPLQSADKEMASDFRIVELSDDDMRAVDLLLDSAQRSCSQHSQGDATLAVPRKVECVCAQLLSNGMPQLLGLDIEWRPSFVRGIAPGPVALLQLAFFHADGGCGATARPPRDGRGVNVLLLHLLHSGVTPSLQALLACKDVTKVGVNIGGDALKLKCDYGIEVAGMEELSDIAGRHVLSYVKRVTANVETRRWSLSGLTEEILRAELPKPRGLRLSNWEISPLTPEQQQYAALDAFASLLLWHELAELPQRSQLTIRSHTESKRHHNVDRLQLSQCVP